MLAPNTAPIICDYNKTPAASGSDDKRATLRSLWVPQQSDDSLRGFRINIQSGELPKFVDSGLTSS